MRYLLVLFVLMAPALADEASVRTFMTSAMPDYQVHGVRESGSWALVHWSLGTEAEGMALLRRLGKSWEVATSGGGAMSSGELAQFGVPDSQWGALLGHQLSKEERAAGVERLAEPAWTWLTRKKKITDDDLAGCSAWELTLMRNEIFAVHGRAFQDADLRAYFKARPWYRVDPKFSDGSLSQLEKANADFIMAYQRRTGKL